MLSLRRLHAAAWSPASVAWCVFTALLAHDARGDDVVGEIGGRLRIATCFESRPYTFNYRVHSNSETNVMVGFEVDLFKDVGLEMLGRTAAEGQPYGGDDPEVLVMPYEGIVAALKNASIDLGICGLYRTAKLEKDVDFTPAHLATGLQPVARFRPNPNLRELLHTTFSAFGDAHSQGALLLLICFSLVFSHIIWVTDRENGGMFHKNYGPGIFDALWFSIVTAFTVGYGDKVTTKLLGRMVAMVWMFVGAYCCALFTAAMTAAFVKDRLSVPANAMHIDSVADLAGRTVAVASRHEAALLQLMPQARTDRGASERALQTVAFPSDLEVALALQRGEVEVGVMDQQAALHLNRLAPELKGKLSFLGPLLSQDSLSFALSRPNGAPHPLLPAFSDAVVTVMRGTTRVGYEELLQRWFGGQEEEEEVLAIQAGALRKDHRLGHINAVLGLVLLAIAGIWSVALLLHYRAQNREGRVRQKLIRALGLGRRYTLKEVRKGAEALFDRTDRDKSHRLDMAEIRLLLQRLGKSISLGDIHRYVRTAEEGVHPLSMMRGSLQHMSATGRGPTRAFRTPSLDRNAGLRVPIDRPNRRETAPVGEGNVR